MNQHLLFLVVGLGAGAAYAAIAMALVTTYRGTGVVNIAQGAMAVLGVYVFQDLRIQHELSTPPAMVLGLLSVAVVALVLHVLVFRPLRTAPPLSRVVASVGITIVIQAAIVLQFGTGRRAVPATLPTEPVHVLGITFSRDRLWLAAAAVCLAVVLVAYGRFTRLGLATGTNLTAAYRAYDGMGAAPWRRRAAAALRERGLTVPRRVTTSTSDLTDTEIQLVRLVRDGLSNRQIATAMHYSPKTIEVYLSRLYAKTGCASRLELIRAVDTGALEV